MIKHIKCDIFESGADIICHQVNCQGAMNSGIAKQVREKYPWVYWQYKLFCDRCRERDASPLGYIQGICINERQVVVNVFGQDGYGYDGKRYTDYSALKRCLKEIREDFPGTTIAIPYMMSCYRGGGDWNVVYKIIEEVFTASNIDVLICEYNGG